VYIIGINGWTTSGKSTVTSVLRHLDPRWQVHKFAAPLKEAVLNFVGEEKETPENKAALRPLYPAYGTYMKQRYGDAYWADKALARMIFSGDQFIIVDDLRYQVEADRLRATMPNLVLIRLDLSPATRDARYLRQYGKPLAPEVAAHISEHDLDDYPHFTARIDAGKDIDRVLSQVVEVLEGAGIPFPYSAHVLKILDWLST
jgi:hypothetical protein